jgi:hypothetical protein
MKARVGYIIKKVDIQDKELTIKNDRNEFVIGTDEFQKLFRIGYTFTTHSSQGMSIDKPYTIHEFNRMSKKLKYVPLSCSTKHEYILCKYILYIMNTDFRNVL